jgi:pyroglutamyl-peptidase
MPGPRPATPAPTCLLTGFEPFGGDAFNPSWEIAARLAGWEVPPWPDPAPGAPAPPLAVVRSVRLPCVFGEALAALDEALERHRPVAVIALGLAASRHEISVERVAINVDDARIPDNAGRQPIDAPVCAEGPAAYWSSLPIKAIVAALREAGIPAAVSQSAGTFVCNHVFYGLAHRLAGAARPGKGAKDGAGEPAAAPLPRFGGFIHVPWPGSGDPQASGADPAPDLETQVEAIRTALRVTLAADGSDLRLPGGSVD